MIYKLQILQIKRIPYEKFEGRSVLLVQISFNIDHLSVSIGRLRPNIF